MTDQNGCQQRLKLHMSKSRGNFENPDHENLRQTLKLPKVMLNCFLYTLCIQRIHFCLIRHN